MMLVLLAGIFWLTITGANLPSAASGRRAVPVAGPAQRACSLALGAPVWLHGALVSGRLPGAGLGGVGDAAAHGDLLPAVHPAGGLRATCPGWPSTWTSLSNAAGACGKQALTMCMGFGCNAAGVVGCRIIDSPAGAAAGHPDQQLCPLQRAVPHADRPHHACFLWERPAGPGRSLLSALLLTGVILLGASAMTLLVSAAAVRHGAAGRAFLLHAGAAALPAAPDGAGASCARCCDRTLFVLARAVTAAAPAGLLLWLMANLTVGGEQPFWRTAPVFWGRRGVRWGWTGSFCWRFSWDCRPMRS